MNDIKIGDKLQIQCYKRLDFILKYELGNLIDMVRTREMPFNKETINTYYQKYLDLTSK